MFVDLKSWNYELCFIVKRDTKRIDFVVFLLSIKVIAGMMWGLGVVMMSASAPGSMVSTYQLTHHHQSPTLSTGPHTPHPRPLRTCQTVSVLPWLNQSCELYNRPVHRQNSPKDRVQIICEIRVSVKHYRDICRLLGRFQNISFSINQF